MVLYPKILSKFEKELPKVLWISGPEGIGKQTLAQKLALQVTFSHNVCVIGNPGVAEIRRLRSFIKTNPIGGKVKVVILHMEGATSAACEALLKILEEVVGSVCFILVSERRLSLTIESRSYRLMLPFLEQSVIKRILLDGGIREEIVDKVAEISGGSITRAKRLLEGEGERDLFIKCLRAMGNGNLVLLTQTLPKLKDMNVDFLSCFVEHLHFYHKFERSLGLFSVSELSFLGKDLGKKMRVIDEIMSFPCKATLKVFLMGLEVGNYSGV